MLKTGDLLVTGLIVDFLFIGLAAGIEMRTLIVVMISPGNVRRLFGNARASHLLAKGRGIRCLRFRSVPERTCMDECLTLHSGITLIDTLFNVYLFGGGEGNFS